MFSLPQPLSDPSMDPPNSTFPFSLKRKCQGREGNIPKNDIKYSALKKSSSKHWGLRILLPSPQSHTKNSSSWEDAQQLPCCCFSEKAVETQRTTDKQTWLKSSLRSPQPSSGLSFTCLHNCPLVKPLKHKHICCHLLEPQISGFLLLCKIWLSPLFSY